MSEVRESQAVRAAVPEVKAAPARSGAGTWIMVTGVAVVCGSVLALALGGDHRSASAEAIGVAREVPLEAPLPAVGAAPEGDAPTTLAAASEGLSIEMYSASWCHACANALRWLGQQGITYREIYVDGRADTMGQLSMLNPRRTLPTFDVDGDVVIGFDSGRLSRTIEGAARRHR